MTEKDLIICVIVILFYSLTYCSWQIASIRDELRQVMKQLKGEQVKIYLLCFDSDISDELCGSGSLDKKAFKTLNRLYEEVNKMSEKYGIKFKEEHDYYVEEFEVID